VVARWVQVQTPDEEGVTRPPRFCFLVPVLVVGLALVHGCSCTREGERKRDSMRKSSVSCCYRSSHKIIKQLTNNHKKWFVWQTLLLVLFSASQFQASSS
jgi:hypothetical protein